MYYVLYTYSDTVYHFVPVEPKPPVPRTVSERSSTTSNSAFKKGTMASCATRSNADTSAGRSE